ncbi:MAG: ABC transporter ATP-binding protein, partial [Spirochaetales bacterium]|nr:ABC transporter ATP-binding protein [Spirochaetales bacterium]
MNNKKDNMVDNRKVWPILGWILRLTKGSRQWLTISVILSILLSFLNIIEARTLGKVTDLVTRLDLDGMYGQLVVLGIIISSYVGLMILSSYSGSRYAESGLFTIRRKLTESTLDLPISTLDREKTGDLVSRLNNDLNLIRQFLHQGIGTLFQAPILIIASTTYVYLVNWQLALVATVFTPAFMFFATKITKPVERHTRSMQQGQAELNILAHDSISGFTELKAFNLADEMTQNARAKIDVVVDRLIALDKWHTLIAPINMVIQSIPELSIFLVGGFLVLKGDLTLGELIVFSRLVHFISHPAQIVSRFLSLLREFIPGAERIIEVWEKPKEASGGITQKSDGKVVLGFEKVGFQYRGGTPILRDCSFHIDAGETVALVGHSGGGKTTIMRLISRFYQQDEGRVLLFGQDANEWDIDSYRDNMALVSQDTYLFPNTIYWNIACGKSDANDRQVKKAASDAECIEFIDAFPQGWETQVGERGVRLSTGQRQRVAIARALLKD